MELVFEPGTVVSAQLSAHWTDRLTLVGTALTAIVLSIESCVLVGFVLSLLGWFWRVLGQDQDSG